MVTRKRLMRRVQALPRRPADAHKGTAGTVLVVAGSEAMLGAAILCSRAALRGGAGLVRTCLPRTLLPAFLGAVPAAIGWSRSGPVVRWLAGVDAVVVGPGLGTGMDTRTMVRGLLKHCRVPLVLDADALNVLAPLTSPLVGDGTRSPAGPDQGAVRILTPHPGEAARLLGCSTAEIQQDRLAHADHLQEASGALVVLKGAGTIVTDETRRFVNTTGNPGLATGGSGDVLAGLLAALLAQGMAPFEAACLAVHTHGAAGDLVARRLSQPGLCAEDLPLAIAEVLR